jgi:hypothetical protein
VAPPGTGEAEHLAAKVLALRLSSAFEGDVILGGDEGRPVCG